MDTASSSLPKTWLERLLSYDEAVLLRARRLQAPWITRLMRTLTRLGDASNWVAIGLALAASGAARHALLLGSASTLATLVSQPLKRLCRRRRPSHGIAGFTALAENPDAFSFPSGHTAAAFAVAVALAGEGHGMGSLSLALACAIGTSRVYLGAHYPLDVAVGSLLGGLAGLTARFLVGAL